MVCFKRIVKVFARFAVVLFGSITISLLSIPIGSIRSIAVSPLQPAPLEITRIDVSGRQLEDEHAVVRRNDVAVEVILHGAHVDGPGLSGVLGVHVQLFLDHFTVVPLVEDELYAIEVGFECVDRVCVVHQLEVHVDFLFESEILCGVEVITSGIVFLLLFFMTVESTTGAKTLQAILRGPSF